LQETIVHKETKTEQSLKIKFIFFTSDVNEVLFTHIKFTIVYQPMSRITLIFVLFFICSCKGTDCEKLPKTFASYVDAEHQIEHSSFKFTDDIRTEKSSWLKGAEYFSCDNQFGFFILHTDKGDYIHQNLPLEIWYDFKNASSFGSYYSRNIRNRYQLRF